jgi:hypothetical protein
VSGQLPTSSGGEDTTMMRRRQLARQEGLRLRVQHGEGAALDFLRLRARVLGGWSDELNQQGLGVLGKKDAAS